MELRSAQPPAIDTGARLVWRLVSPAARLVCCHVRRSGTEFELVVSAGSDDVMVWTAPELTPLHARAAEWRATLEQRGYRAAGAVSHSSERPCEARAAFRGLIECSDVLGLHDRGAASILREHATAGLVAVALQDADLISDAIALSRAALRDLVADGDVSDLVASCEALLSRIEATFRFPAA